MPNLSRTAAKRQAHGEGKMYNRGHGTGWTVYVDPGEGGRPAAFIHAGQTYQGARAELARWRAARVRALMGEKVLSFGADPDCNPSPQVEHEARGWEPR